MKRTLVVVTAVAAALTLAACSDSDSGGVSPEAGGSSGEPTCAESTPVDKHLAAIETVELPDGVTLTGGRAAVYDGEFGATILLCAPGMTADDLRPLATDFAIALKAGKDGKRIISMTLDSYQVDGPASVNEVVLEDEQFADHAWDGSSDAEDDIWVDTSPGW